MARNGAKWDGGAWRRGFGPFRETWLSYCSSHRQPVPDCRRCNSGRWVNDWALAVSGFVYRVWPSAWRKWVNRGRK